MAEDKNIVATLFLKNQQAVRSFKDHTVIGDVYEIAKLYNDSGVDKLIIFDLSDNDEEHAQNVHTIQNINRNIEVRVCAGGNINRVEDVKQLFYAGCKQVILNGAKGSSMGIADMVSSHFGQESVLLSISTVDFIFKYRKRMEGNFHELLLMNPKIMDALESTTKIPYIVYYDNEDYKEKPEEFARTIVDTLKRKNVRGIAGRMINDPATDVMKLKSSLSSSGFIMDNFAPELSWKDLKLNSDGMVPVIVQDYRTDEVLMLAYMNEEAFNTTINIGKMTYWSRSRNELWIKGMTSGHFQYVKSLTADCDYDTILAKVSQVGAACHTGSRSCFFNEIVKKDYVDKNPLHVLETVYADIKNRQINPKAGSYTNMLLEKGLDEVLGKLCAETGEIVIAAKNPDEEKIKYEISDFLYHCMILMAQKNISWQDITRELSQR